ncbi:MAG: hypothetical protein KJ622_10710 [Alphaproteobacteria bacterium]|nr:hypothetical protein [Alphaproteobacteria bacterium]
MANETDGKRAQAQVDAARAVRFMAVKASIFIVVPLIVGVAVAWWVLQ